MDSFCYICLEKKEDLSQFTPKNVQGTFLVCEDCLEEDIPKWTLQEWQSRSEQYLKRKNHSTQPKVQPKEEIKVEAEVKVEVAPVKLPQEEAKEIDKNMYIFLEQNLLKYSMKDSTWEGIEMTLDFDSALISPDQEISFSLLSTSSACVQVSGLDWVDVVLSGGISYPLYSFFGKLIEQAYAVNLISGPKLKEARHQHTMAASQEPVTKRVFAAGGLKFLEEQKKEPTLKIEELCLDKKGEWSEIGQLKETRISAASLVIKEVLFILGGFTLSQDKPVSFIQSIDVQTKDHKSMSVKLAQEMGYPLAGFRVAQDSQNLNKILLFGGTSQSYVFNCVYSLNIENQELEFVMYTYNYRADFPIAYVNEENVLLVGGAESGGKSEIVDLKNKTSTPIFDYQNCLETIPTSQGVEFSDLRWCCYFFK